MLADDHAEGSLTRPTTGEGSDAHVGALRHVLLDRAGRIVGLLGEEGPEHPGALPDLRTFLRDLVPGASERHRVESELHALLVGDRSSARLTVSREGGARILLGAQRASGETPDIALVITVIELPIPGADAAPGAAQGGASEEDTLTPTPRGGLAALGGAGRELPSVRVDRHLRVREVNAAAHRELGLRQEHVAGRSVLRFLDTASRRRLRTALPALVEMGRLDQLELGLRQGRESVLHVLASVEALLGDDAALKGAHVVLEDPRDRDVLRSRLQEADRFAATGRLAAGIAHELNNPLQSILMHMSLLEEAIPTDPLLADSWQRIGDGIRHIQSVVRRLHELPGEAPSLRAPAEPGRVVEDTVAMARTTLQRAGLSVRVEGAAMPPALLVAERDLRQLVLNLLLYARGVLQRGGGVLLRLRAPDRAHEAVLEMSLSSPALAAAAKDGFVDLRLGSERSPSSSVELLLVQGLARGCGGRIDVDAARGRTVVRVRLPAGGGGDAGAGR